MEKVLIVLGTLPEAVEMCPLVQELRALGEPEAAVCIIGPHRETLERALEQFNIAPDFVLPAIQTEATPYELASRSRCGMEDVLDEYEPDLVFVYADTDTASAAVRACHSRKVPVACVEFE